MKTPSILYRMARREEVTGACEQRIIIAKGPFIFMAYGYLSLPRDARGSAWITCPHGDVLPDEIETVMRQWHQSTRPAPDTA